MSQFMPFPGYNPTPNYEKRDLPCGGYIGRIENAQTIAKPNGVMLLALTLDILEGPYTDWFCIDYESRSSGRYPAAHRGVFRLFYPSATDARKAKYAVKVFNEAIYAIKISNSNYEWNGADAELVGKNVGIIVREVEWNGHVFPEIGKLIPLSDVHSGNFKLLPRKVPKEQTFAAAEQAENNDLPV